MAFTKATLARLGNTAYLAGSTVSVYAYASDDAVGDLLGANYWNSASGRFKKGDLILCATNLDGTPVHALLQVTSATGAATVTVIGSVVGGQAHIADIALAAVTGVDGTGNNAASKADVDTRLTAIQDKINAMLAALEASGHNLTS